MGTSHKKTGAAEGYGRGEIPLNFNMLKCDADHREHNN